MATIHSVARPAVAADPPVPVPEWPLSAVGIGRMRLLVERPWIGAVRAVFGSAGHEALDAARILGGRLASGENDHSVTGYLPKAEFEAVADESFARPAEGVRGRERAADARRRIEEAVDRAPSMLPAGADAASRAGAASKGRGCSRYRNGKGTLRPPAPEPRLLSGELPRRRVR